MNITTDELLMLIGKYVAQAYAMERELGNAQKKLAALLMKPDGATSEEPPQP